MATRIGYVRPSFFNLWAFVEKANDLVDAIFHVHSSTQRLVVACLFTINAKPSRSVAIAAYSVTG